LTPIARRLSCPTLLLLLASCASGQKTAAHTEAIESHVYARPLDDVLAETTRLLVQGGWRVERSEDQLGTNWRPDATGSALGYRVEGARIDGEHCTIRIERIAATSFAPPSQGAQGSARMGASMGPAVPAGVAGGNRSTGWDGMDAPTTLGEAPSGMVTLPRGRDEALEWALLQRLEPRAAEAIRTADARSHPPAPEGTAAGATPAPTTAAPGCEPALSGVDALIAERRFVLLADVPGTKEIPDFVGRLACQAVRTGATTVVALELMRVDQEWVDTYLASRGSAADHAALLHVTRSFDPQTSGGRGTQAVLELLDRILALRDAGFTLRVVAFGEAPNAPEAERSRASALERARRVDPDALLVAVVEGPQARTVLQKGETADGAPLGWYLERWGLQPVPLDLRSPGGQTLSCVSPGRAACGPVPVPATPRGAGTSRSVKLYPSPDGQGFWGEYSVGLLTASTLPKP
jgi:hypothetical protein